MLLSAANDLDLDLSAAAWPGPNSGNSPNENNAPTRRPASSGWRPWLKSNDNTH